jgi:hypothetical protein
MDAKTRRATRIAFLVRCKITRLCAASGRYGSEHEQVAPRIACQKPIAERSADVSPIGASTDVLLGSLA